MPRKYTFDERVSLFWSKVDRSGPIPEHCPELGPCWPYATTQRIPYGRVAWTQGRSLGAHVVAYTLTYGEAAAETPCVLHACDGAAIRCVRPSHLFAGTKGDNARDMARKGRAAFGDRNPMRRLPEIVPRGNAHHARLHPERLARGERNGFARLTRMQVIEIRTRYAAGGVTHTQLGAEYDVHWSTIHAIVTRKNWKHV